MVDGIGKGGPKIPPASPGGVTGPGAPKETGRTFEVEGKQKPSSTAPAQGAGGVAPPNAIEQLRSGQIDVNGYLDIKVNEATAHLKGLTPVQLDAIRSMLRDQISTDPALADLFKQATGHAPPAPSSDD